MNYNLLLELATDLGYRLAMSGAETFRIEESILRILNSYGLKAEAFAIPNCLTVSIITAQGTPMTRMRRIGNHGNDLDAVERYSNLSRRICAEHPSPEDAMVWLKTIELRRYFVPARALGYFLGALGFSFIFGGIWSDAIWAGICGLIVMGIDVLMDRFQAPLFFRTIISAFFAAVPAYLAHTFGLLLNPDAAIIGTLMILVPGLLFTNAMRDIMYGDINSGLHRTVQVLLIAMSIALGTAGALQLVSILFGPPDAAPSAGHSILFLCFATFTGCIGFAILFNVHGFGACLCALGGVLAWLGYLAGLKYSGSLVVANLAGGTVASIYAEVMARIRKYPAISYLVISIFPLIPGAGVYYTMCHAVRGEMSALADKGFETAAVAGAIALGILMISTAFRMYSGYKAGKN